MKKITYFIAVLLLTSISLQAQKQRTEGVITFSVQDVQTTDIDEQHQEMMESIKDEFSFKIFFSQEAMMTEISVMGVLMKNTMMYDDDGKMFLYQESFGQKYKILIDPENLEEQGLDVLNNFDFGNYGENVKLTETSDTKTIAGYETRRVHMLDENADMDANMWVSDKIVYKYPIDLGKKHLNTIPLGMDINQGNLVIRMEANSVEDLPEGALDVDDSQYKHVTMQEFLSGSMRRLNEKNAGN